MPITNKNNMSSECQWFAKEAGKNEAQANDENKNIVNLRQIS
jgi:hypothetical protein